MNRLLVAILVAVFALPVALHGQEAIDIQVHAGFNLISSNIRLPDNFWARDEGPDIRRMFAQFGLENAENPMYLLVNERGNFYAPRNRFNNIAFWSEVEGYAVEMRLGRAIQWEGERLPADAQFQISQGWNMVAYLPTFELDASAPDYPVLSPVIDNIICAIDDDGGFMLPAYDFSNMAPWRSGRGYYVRSAQNVQLQYPAVAGVDDGVWRPLVGDHWSVLAISKDLQPLLINQIDGGDVLDGDMIAAYSPNGVLVGAGTVQDQRCGLTLWGDNRNTNEVDGLRAGEEYTLVYWLSDQDREIEAQIVAFIEGDERFTSLGITVIDISAELGARPQRRGIQLAAGWNLISINFTPTQDFFDGENPGPDVPLMFAQLAREGGAHRVARVVDALGHFYVPARGFNNIPHWPLQEGLWVLMDEAANPQWASELRDPQEELTLGAGWNIVAYMPTAPLDASAPDFHVVSPILDAVVVAKNDHGEFMLPAHNFNNMSDWTPGEGYQIRVNRDVAFVYPEAQDRRAAIEPVVAGTHWSLDPIGRRNLSLLVTGVPGVTLDPADQIAAFDSRGQLVGVGNVSNGMIGLAVWGSDETTGERGLSEGESFDLRLWQESLGMESPLKLGEAPVYHTDDALISSADVVALPTSSAYLTLTPNPFNATAQVAFALPYSGKVSLAVYDLEGALVATLKDEVLTAGTHSAVWNASASPSGVYLLRLATPYGKTTTRGVLIK